MDKVTVDKAYFDALLRRADFHTSAQRLGSHDSSNVSISRVEYDSLLRLSREYDLLKKALFQGGITADTLDLLISGAPGNDQRHDSAVDVTNPWNQESQGSPQFGTYQSSTQPNSFPPRSGMLRRLYHPAQNANAASAGFPNGGSQQRPQSGLRVPSFQREVSYGMSTVPEDVMFDDEDNEFNEACDNMVPDCGGANEERRTIYFNGLSERTTYRDLLSVIKGGKVLSVNLRPERSALVTFVDGASEFLAWVKRNDIYLHTKRIEIKWADRQYRLNNHIAQKIAHGATRNLIIRSAAEKGLTESQIRDDMEHIHNLIIIDIVFSYTSGDAHVSMNSVHNALFARTCMMSRSGYKGCRIEFARDDCDVPLPVRTAPVPIAAVTAGTLAVRKKAKNHKPLMTVNRFDMLNIDGTEGSSDEENRTPSDADEVVEGSDIESVDFKTGVGVSLRFLDSESCA